MMLKHETKQAIRPLAKESVLSLCFVAIFPNSSRNLGLE
jgi:hypothetical protein